MSFVAGQKLRASQLQEMYDGLAIGDPVSTIVSNFVSTSSTSYTRLTGDPSVNFTAPPSGVVLVSMNSAMVSGALSGSAALRESQAGFEIRQGSTPGSGTIVVAANDYNAIKMTGIAAIQCGSAIAVGFLTPGQAYNCCMVYKMGGSGGTTPNAGFAQRVLGVIPIPGL